MLNRLSRHLLLLLVLVLPLQGLAARLMLGCEHEARPGASAMHHDGHDTHHEHGAGTASAERGQAQGGAEALACDDCELCDLCASPALSAAPSLAPLAPPSAEPPGLSQPFASITLEEPPRPPRHAGA